MKKTIFQAFLLSGIVHNIYIMSTVGWGHIQYYIPDVVNQYQSVSYLQSEVAVGIVVSPLWYVSILCSLLGGTLLFLLLLWVIKKQIK
ncbi:hypothetical protein [Bacillus alkalicellulosilyticus]|uniref:hypothetical protein n=1 Tax=Alkalihalobacterium alkalicellulosilyticum TaxID=1912214 RepID=UPI0009986693|nr:hypothetical protein [Bacillus alkalicellulosilyticus]